MSKLFVPFNSPVLDPVNMEMAYVRKERSSGFRELLMPSAWQAMFRVLQKAFSQLVFVVTSVSASAQTTSIASTALTGPLAVGVYRLTYYMRITQAADISSSLDLTIGWVDGGVACSTTVPTPAMSGNTTHTTDTGSILFAVDQDSQVTYATTLTTLGTPAAEYSLNLSLEMMP